MPEERKQDTYRVRINVKRASNPRSDISFLEGKLAQQGLQVRVIKKTGFPPELRIDNLPKPDAEKAVGIINQESGYWAGYSPMTSP